ncbi:MAG: DUF3307 domain-containing protein [Cognaticolwellia sp.]
MELLLMLLTAHFIADFYLQPAHWVACRNTKHLKSAGLWQHFLVHILLNSLVFLLSELALLPAVMAITVISVSHLLTDYWKSYRETNLRYFLFDQGIHILIICLVWAYLFNVTLAQFMVLIANVLSAKNILVAISYLLVCKPASVIISLALKKHTDSLTSGSVISQGASNDEDLGMTTTKSNDISIKRKNIGLLSAGAWIGYIERCLAISFIFIGQFAGIGFLVATKTIFRFGDLTKNKDMKLTEYMMLGTLLSYAIALFIGWNTLQIYKML